MLSILRNLFSELLLALIVFFMQLLSGITQTLGFLKVSTGNLSLILQYFSEESAEEETR